MQTSPVFHIYPPIYIFIRSLKSFHIPVCTAIFPLREIESTYYCLAQEVLTRGLACQIQGCA